MTVEEAVVLATQAEQYIQVSQYKYPGVIIDNKRNWETQASAVFKNINKRMVLIRKLSSFSVDKTLLYLFSSFKSVIPNFVSFGIIA